MILVTGGCGFIGSALVKALVAQDHAVRVLDDCSRGAARRLAGVTVDFINGDVRDRETMRRAMAGVNEVWHLAFINGTENFYRMPDRVLDVGVRGMLNVLDHCIGKRLFLISSSEVYQTPPVIPTDETVPLSIPDPYNPRYSYAAGKIVSEMMALHASYLSHLVIARPHNIYGPDMGNEHVIPQMARRVVKGDVLEFQETVPVTVSDSKVFWGCAETRAFCFIDDAVKALMVLRERGGHREIYNVGTSEEVSIVDLAIRIAACAKRKIRVTGGKGNGGGPLRRCPDITKIRALGFEPRVFLDEGLGITLDWYWKKDAHMPSL